MDVTTVQDGPHTQAPDEESSLMVCSCSIPALIIVADGPMVPVHSMRVTQKRALSPLQEMLPVGNCGWSSVRCNYRA